jgi:hypothetical protein
MNVQPDSDDMDVRSDVLNENVRRLGLPLAVNPSAPRLRKTSSAQLAVQRTEAWRQERVATAAYYLAEKRGFAPGHETEDWLLAEAQVDAADAAS